MRWHLWALLATSQASRESVLAKVSVTACASLVSNVTWEYISEDYYAPLCLYEPALGSWMTCVNEFIIDNESEMSTRGRELYVNYMTQSCARLETHHIVFTEEQFIRTVNNASNYLVNDTVTNWSGRAPVQFNPDDRRLLGVAWGVNMRNLGFSNTSSMYLYAFLAVVSVLAAMAHHMNSAVFHTKTMNQIRSKLTLPTLHRKHAQPVIRAPGGLIPTRLELSIILGFLGAHAVALIYGYEFDEKEVLEGRSMQLLRFVGYRTGLLAFAQFPLIVFFSGRNSMFELFTGLHYTTSIVLHKWISRVMVFDGFVHGILFALRAYILGYFSHLRESRFYVCGSLALWAGIFLCLLAFGILRHRWYETFLVTHIVLAVAFFYYSWEHAKNLGWCEWVYVSIGLWILEKVLRGTRIMAFGGTVKAHAQFFEPDIVRVAIPKPRRGWKTHPGEYVFIYFLFRHTWWQSHPFTFVDLGDRIAVVVKAKKGVTNTLLAKVKESGGSAFVPVCVEGPYGESAPVSAYDGKLFICGGSGIPGPLSYVLNTPKPRMLLVVVARDLDIINAFKTELLALPDDCVQIYITSRIGTVHNSINDPVWERENVISGRRPDVDAIIHQFINTDGSLAITCCGPPALVDTTRDTAANALRACPTKRLGYFEEYQTW